MNDTAKYKELLIFDLDGTLIDSTDDIAWSANRTLERMGYDVMDVQTIKDAVGWGVKMLLRQLMPLEDEPSIDRARDIFLDVYKDHLVVDTTLYPGVAEELRCFSEEGRKLAIVSNKPVALTEGVVTALGLRDLFFAVLGGDSLPTRKPDPEPLLKVIADAGLSPGTTIYVGDSPVDCDAGQRAGVFTLGAAYGFRGRAELEEADCDAIIESFYDVSKFVG